MVATPTAAVHRCAEERCWKYTAHLDRKSAGTSRKPSPKKSPTCVVKIVKAIPLVNPITMGYGIKRITTPKRNSPISTSITPAIAVATANPSKPNCWMIPYTMTIKAPVGPPICTELPPKSETMNPPITAVISPFSGLTPEAIPNAMAKGRATIPTMMPAIRSAANFPFE